jgi:hypothetical protein
MIWLVGCQNNKVEGLQLSNINKNSTEVSSLEQQRKETRLKQEEAQKVKEDIQRKKMFRAYRDVMYQTIKINGFWNNEFGQLDQDSSGVAYADLIDFDNDGISELYLVHGEHDKFVETVWGYKDGRAVQIANNVFKKGNRFDSDSRYLVSTDTFTYLVSSGRLTHGGQGDVRYRRNLSISSQTDCTDTVYKLENGKFIKVSDLIMHEIYYEDDELKTYYYRMDNNNEITISKEEYEKNLALYSGSNSKQIVKDDVGTKVLGDDVEVKPNKVLQLWRKLNVDLPTLSNSANGELPLSKSDKLKLNSFMNNFADLGEYDRESYTDEELIFYLFYAIHNGTLSDDLLQINRNDNEALILQDNWYYYPYNVQKIHSLTKKLFGVKLREKDYRYKENELDLKEVIFKDGKFYFLSPEFGGSILLSSAQVQHMYDLGDGQYYIDYTLFEYEVTDERDLSYLVNKTSDEWNEKEREYMLNQIDLHAILQKTNSDWQILYKKGLPSF